MRCKVLTRTGGSLRARRLCAQLGCRTQPYKAYSHQHARITRNLPIHTSSRRSPSLPTMTPPIAILGAGPSGLILGRLLEVANIDYTIFERGDEATWADSGVGGTLDIHTGSGQLALREAGLLDEFKALARFEQVITIADANGKIYVQHRESGDQDKPEIDRRDLQLMLRHSVPDERIQWNKRVQQVQTETDGSMSVQFVDGSCASGFRLIVGADGAWSKARKLVSRVTIVCALT